MPQYVFVCQDCKKEFEEHLHMTDVDKAEVTCPSCGSKRVTHQVEAFYAVTGRKS